MHRFRRSLVVGMVVATVLGVLVSVRAQRAPDNGGLSTAVSAANAFIAGLTSVQRDHVLYAYGDTKKATWHNLPPQMMPRAGATLGELTAPQRDAAMAVLTAVLSPYGYDKVLKTMDADQYLGTDMGAAFPTGPRAYSLAIFGTPSLVNPWAIQFNGHHLGLNVVIAGPQRTMAPSLTGAYPAVYKRDGKDVRVLGDENDRAYALINSLSAPGRSKAVLPYGVLDLVLGPGHDGKRIEPEGLKASDMNAEERDKLLSLAAAWIEIVNVDASRAKIAEVRANLGDTYFAWSGGTTAGSNIYFRIQGPTVFIEYSTQVNPGGPGRGGRGAPNNLNNAGLTARGASGDDLRDPNHIHTVYRDFTNDYGHKYSMP